MHPDQAVGWRLPTRRKPAITNVVCDGQLGHAYFNTVRRGDDAIYYDGQALDEETATAYPL